MVGFFGGGFARGLQGGISAGNQIAETQMRKQQFQAQQEAARLELMEKNFQRMVETLQLFEPTLEAAPQAFAEGTATRAQFDKALDLLRTTAAETGRDPGLADAIGEAFLSRTQIQPDAQSPIGKLIQDRNALPEDSPDRAALDKSIEDAIREDPDTQTVNVRSANGDQVTLLINSKTGATVAELGRGPSVQFQPTELPASKQQQIAERGDVLQQGIEQVESLLALPEGTFGAAASVKRSVRGVARTTGELLDLGLPDSVAGPLKGLAQIGESLIDQAVGEGRLDAETAAEVSRSDLTEAETVEIQLAFLVANALQPDGKLLKDSINSARQIVKLSGFTSEKTARERLATVLNILKRSQKGLKGSAESVGKKPGGESESKKFRYNPETNELEPVQ